MDITKKDGSKITIENEDILLAVLTVIGPVIHIQSFDLDEIYNFLNSAKSEHVKLTGYNDGKRDFSGHYIIDDIEKKGESVILSLHNLGMF